MGKTVRAMPTAMKKEIINKRKYRKVAGNVKRGLYVIKNGEKERKVCRDI